MTKENLSDIIESTNSLTTETGHRGKIFRTEIPESTGHTPILLQGDITQSQKTYILAPGIGVPSVLDNKTVLSYYARASAMLIDNDPSSAVLSILNWPGYGTDSRRSHGILYVYIFHNNTPSPWWDQISNYSYHHPIRTPQNGKQSQQITHYSRTLYLRRNTPKICQRTDSA